MLRALVRPVPDSFAEATTLQPLSEGIDVHLARRQHSAYVGALRRAGCEILVVPVAHELPDSCFVEDQVVIVGSRALVTRSGNASRRAEASAVRTALAPLLDLFAMEAPATLDGGDVVKLDGHLLVGQSARTNPAALARLREVFSPLGVQVTGVPVPPHELHLKGFCSPVTADTVLVAAGTVDPSIWPAGVRVIEVPTAADFAANVVRAGETLLVAASRPEVARALAPLGLRCEPVDTSELRKGDGALTCLSVVFDAP